MTKCFDSGGVVSCLEFTIRSFVLEARLWISLSSNIRCFDPDVMLLVPINIVEVETWCSFCC